VYTASAIVANIIHHYPVMWRRVGQGSAAVFGAGEREGAETGRRAAGGVEERLGGGGERGMGGGAAWEGGAASQRRPCRRNTRHPSAASSIVVTLTSCLSVREIGREARKRDRESREGCVWKTGRVRFRFSCLAPFVF
jgi:hypothetical protein